MSMSKKTRKQLILDTVSDLVGRFLYYDRKEDESLPRGSIDNAVSTGEITEAEIVEAFRAEIEKGLVRK